jgi:hypothetical protein
METDYVETYGENSWWVFRRHKDGYGRPIPYSRVVHFAGSEAAALDWIERQHN